MLAGVGRAADAAETPKYKTGYKSIRMLGLDLYKALKPKMREVIGTEPVSVETDVSPGLKLADFTDEGKTVGFVFVTVGMIDLMNNVAHAKAIDKIEKGYFEKYVLSLAQESGAMELKELPNVANPKYWSEGVLNEQLSNFNQMVGTAVSIKLAHHILGHYKKYAAKLEDAQGKRTPINNLLAPDEWDAAMKMGVRNALEAGLGIEGITAFWEAIDKMPKRPDWTAYFLPATAKVKPMRKDMEKIEKKFFAGEE